MYNERFRLKLAEFPGHVDVRSVVRTDCHHSKGHDATCASSGTMYMVVFGLVEIVLAQFPNLEKLTFISVVAAVMSCTYSFVGLLLSAAKLASNHAAHGTLLGVKIGAAAGVSTSSKTWHSLQALGNIACAYSYSMLLIEIQVTKFGR
jgi:hypothetical protein